MQAPQRREDGYIMVALLVSMAVAAVWATVLLPAWRQQALRQKEDDLIFRGEQYARAIALYYNKNQAYPPTVDVLVTQRFLRKKWKDPITDKDFLLVPAPSATGQQQSQPVGGRSGGVAPGGAIAPGTQLTSGFIGVRSQSPATSIKVYQQQQVYNQWQFDYANACQRMGTCNQGQGQGPGRGGPGGRDGGGRDGRGGPTTVGPGGRPGGPGGPAIGTPPAGPRGPGGTPPPPPAPGRGRGE